MLSEFQRGNVNTSWSSEETENWLRNQSPHGSRESRLKLNIDKTNFPLTVKTAVLVLKKTPHFELMKVCSFSWCQEIVRYTLAVY